ncbi:hypothetical protein PGT21_010248 [Puccinia graminis f. sp. tritici]|uniref:C2H2-type domain-containing protein n=3 Tax=Puccinia graminis f. sp. tritici TaxID=56615 RepID=A0A5B0PB23_PUCGR|nr:hypothetical protein PGT21_010248 [Puccinia graminis f. sp. tritici]
MRAPGPALDYQFSDGLYLCHLCPRATGTKNWRRHCASVTHQRQVQHRAEARRVSQPVVQETVGAPGDPGEADQHDDHIQEDNAHGERVWERIERFLALDEAEAALDTNTRALDNYLDELESRGAREGGANLGTGTGQGPNWRGLAETALMGFEVDKDDHIVEDPPILRTDKRSDRVNKSPWYPFKSQMDLIASLIVGHTHSMLSRSLYTKIRAILTLCGLRLPAWSTVRTSRERIRGLLGSKIGKAVSVFDVPCYALSAKKILSQELANPRVSKFLDYYPEMTDGLMIKKFSQSGKWLSGMSRAIRPQMCEAHGKHFYIYEPVQLRSHVVVVPVYLFMYQSVLHARCWEILDDHITSTETSVEGNLSTVLNIRMPLDLDFDDARLRSIPVHQFDVEYSGIRWEDGRLLVEACAGKIFDGTGLSGEVLTFPNPWRAKAKNMILRNVPITLYSDDTSGNVSKQFNKHISFYFTLSGLPPHLSNQEYNCHFLSTSNLASVGEIAEQIVEEMNDMTTEGFEAYDHSIGQKVWVTSSVFCFLADSPMHAEVTCTPNPGASINPCRMCKLSVSMKRLKRTRRFIRAFLGRGFHGNKVRGNPREWEETKSRCRELWEIATTQSWNQFVIKCKEYGLKDTITTRLLTEAKLDSCIKEKMMNMALGDSNRLYSPFLQLIGFDGVRDTPVEVLHVVLLGVVKYLARDLVAGISEGDQKQLVGRLQSFDCAALNISSFKPKYLIKHIKSLVGRDFKILLQAAPFVFGEWMSEEQKPIWFALCKLAPLIFQTCIDDMDAYLIELTQHIDIFLFHIIRSTAQWVNKPKFHMLVHLVECIRRFGPASLFATEKFESYNGVLRKASVHSNKLAPGRDLATSFNDFGSLRFVVSGGIVLDNQTGGTRPIGTSVTSVFDDNPSVQKSMGYNHLACHPDDRRDYPRKARGRVGEKMVSVPPEALLEAHPSAVVKQVGRVDVSEHDRVGSGSFVVVGESPMGELVVGHVDSLWEVSANGSSPGFFASMNVCISRGVDDWYQMRKLRRSGRKSLVNVKFILGCINVQHNCHRGECPVELTKEEDMERQATGRKGWQVEHSDQEHYIINSGALRNAVLHRRISGLPMELPDRHKWTEAIDLGLGIWNTGLDPIQSDDEHFDEYQPGSEDDAEGETDSEFARSSNSSGSDNDEDADGETDSEYDEV